MPVTSEEAKRTPIDLKKCKVAEEEILSVLNDANLTLRELLLVLGNTLINIGSTLEENKKKLTYDDIRRMYSMSPSLGTALMALGADILAEWIEIPLKQEIDNDRTREK